MKDNLVLLRAKNIPSEKFVLAFCGNPNDKRIIGIAVVKKDIGVLNKNEKLIILENNNDLSVQALIEQFIIFPSYKGIELFPLKLDLTRPESYNVIKAFRNNDIIYIPFDEVINKYNEYLKLKNKVKLHKKVLSKEEAEKFYNELGFPQDETIDKTDYIDFYLNFGNKLELYKSLVDLKKNSEITWKELKKIKLEDIDEKKGVIYIASHRKIDTYEL